MTDERIELLPPCPAKDELLRLLAERYIRTLTPGTFAHAEVGRLLVAAGLWSIPPQ